MIDKHQIQVLIDELQALLDQQDTAYDYEKTFDEQWQQLGQRVFQSSLGPIAVDRNKKNDTD